MNKLTINIQELSSCAHGKFEEQNKVLEPSIISINYALLLVILTYLLTPWSRVPLEKLTGFCS